MTYSGSEGPLRLQPVSDRVPEVKHDAVIRQLTDYALAWGAWLRGELPPPEYLEAQHSLVLNLALELGDGANNKMNYPDLVKTLRISERWEQACLDLGADRNRVKHRGQRHEAERYVEKYVECVYAVSHNVTGIDAMPVTAHLLNWESAGEQLRPPLMFDRWGKRKRFTRY